MEKVDFYFEVAEAAKAHVGKVLRVRAYHIGDVNTRTYLRGFVELNDRVYSVVVSQYPNGHVCAHLEFRLRSGSTSRIYLHKLKFA